MLHEISRTSIPFVKHEEPFVLWHKDTLGVRMEKGVQVYEFTYNLQCFDKHIDHESRIVPTPKSSPLSKLIPQKLLNGMPNLEFTQMIIDPSLWPHNPQLVNEMANVVAFKFSPAGMVFNNISALAVLNNVGGAEIFIPGRTQWRSVLNFSEIIKSDYLASGSQTSPQTFEEVKEVVDKLETTAICWGPLIENHTCVFIAGQKNGTIIFWLLHYHEPKIKVDFLKEVPTDMGELIELVIIQKTDYNFLLIYTTVSGQTYALDYSLDGNTVHSITCLWAHKDKMVTKYIQYMTFDDKIILVYNKHRHLLVQLIDQNCTVISQCVKNVNDYKITDIKINNAGMYISTINCKIYKLNFKIIENNIDVDFILIELKEAYPSHDLHGITFSHNNVIMALCMMDRRIKNRKTTLETAVVFVTDPELSETNLLLENPLKKLTDYWDCIEILRYKTMKIKLLPSIDYDQLYAEAETDVYKLKLYLVFAILYDNLEKQSRNNSKAALPETSVELIREKILANRASQIINELYNTFINTGKMLEGIHWESYSGAKWYLQYYCRKYDKNINDFATSKSLSVPSIKQEVICQCCDDSLKGFTCRHGHLNMFCSLTFTLIEGFEYLVCKCGCTARMELSQNQPMCLFCDLYLNNYTLPE